jgi:hypothetical protein
VVDYDKPIRDNIKEGKFDEVDAGNMCIRDNTQLDYACEALPPSGKHGKEKVRLKLLKFEQDVEVEQSPNLVRQAGYEPANSEHGLAFARSYPEVQLLWPIVIPDTAHKHIGHGWEPITLCFLGKAGRDQGSHKTCKEYARYLGFHSENWGKHWPRSARYLAVVISPNE